MNDPTLSDIVKMLDGLAVSTERGLANIRTELRDEVARLQGDTARIETGINAFRTDLHSLRVEMRASSRPVDERLTRLEAAK